MSKVTKLNHVCFMNNLCNLLIQYEYVNYNKICWGCVEMLKLYNFPHKLLSNMSVLRHEINYKKFKYDVYTSFKKDPVECNKITDSITNLSNKLKYLEKCEFMSRKLKVQKIKTSCSKCCNCKHIIFYAQQKYEIFSEHTQESYIFDKNKFYIVVNHHLFKHGFENVCLNSNDINNNHVKTVKTSNYNSYNLCVSDMGKYIYCGVIPLQSINKYCTISDIVNETIDFDRKKNIINNVFPQFNILTLETLMNSQIKQ